MDAPELKNIPEEPGVYLFKDSALRIIYVGKARNLRRRVSSYFRGHDRLTPKTRTMLGQAASLDTLCTATEKEALLLEASLIKKHRPRYNILLRDDKQYVLFKLDKSTDYPRLVITRRVEGGAARYYGPFTSGLAAKEAWRAIHRAFPLRRCKDALFRNRVRPCLYHHIGGCPAPCVCAVPKEAYAAMVRQVELLLSGRSNDLVAALEREMRAASDALEFEKAAVLRDRVAAVRATVERQAAVLPRPRDMDVLGLHVQAGEAGDAGSDAVPGGGTFLALGVLFVRQGRLMDKKSFVWRGMGLEEAAEVVGGFLAQYYGPGRFVPETVFLPPQVGLDALDGADALAEALAEVRGAPVRLALPRSAEEKQLSAMAATNAREDARCNRAGTGESLLAALGARLRLPGPPERIEAVDVSHTGGGEARIGMVVFEHGEPRKDAYRAYAVTGAGAAGDDFAALAEWARRRVAAGPPWPDLVLVDGGPGQLAAVGRALREAGAPEAVSLAGIAKEHAQAQGGGSGAARRHAGAVDRIFLPGRKNPLALAGGSAELLFLQRVRDAAHDFVISRHRRARNREALAGGLLDLPGVGEKTARLLWDRFASLEAMAAASPDELACLPGLGRKRALALHEALAGWVVAHARKERAR
ncbi:MAG: excinuclease ABC subunit UvrC [Desulfovibrionaceae bacterium]